MKAEILSVFEIKSEVAASMLRLNKLNDAYNLDDDPIINRYLKEVDELTCDVMDCFEGIQTRLEEL